MPKHDPTNRLFDRRGFLRHSTLATLTTLLGTELVFADQLPRHYLPLAFDFTGDPADPMTSKHKDMIVLNDKPWNVETPPHLLDDRITPADRMFIRNNGLIPDVPENVDAWTLTINGESVKAHKTYTLAELKKRFKPYTYQLVLECGGNGRSGFEPQTSGNPWDQGAVSCAQWTGVRLRDILADVGLKADAVYIG
ncbi:MAG: molybdopterin-dependent oxidoreductase, partial [Rudanella sp.]|nr:molybdopterin-dependent oxidoreductase [Rudanella sp.]